MRYYFALALRGLRRTPWLAFLMILSLAVGIAASMTTMTLRYVLGLDPIPGKSGRLLNLQPKGAASPTGNMFSYADAMALSRAPGRSTMSVVSGAGVTTSISVVGRRQSILQGVGLRYATRRFFDIFNVELERGRIWTRQEASDGAPVVVLQDSMARYLFHGAHVVGKHLRMADTDYTIIGVVRNWNPRPRYYNLDGVAGAFGGGGDAIFLPLAAIRYAPATLMVTRACPGMTDSFPGPSHLLSSRCRWLNVWYLAQSNRAVPMLSQRVDAQLPSILSPEWASHLRLLSVSQMLVRADVVPGPVRLYATLGVAFLLLCAINASGMQLSRALRSTPQIGIRRALGASRSEIIKQYMCDSLLVSGVGGMLGMLLTFAGLYGVRHLPGVYYTDLAHMNGPMFTLMLAMVFVSGVLVGVLPAWVASRADPAMLIKVQQ